MPSFAIVDSHVHLYDPTWLRYGWLAKVPRINRSYDLSDFDRCRGEVEVDKLVFAEVAVDPGLHFAEAAWVQGLADADPLRQFAHAGELKHPTPRIGRILIAGDDHVLVEVGRQVQAHRHAVFRDVSDPLFAALAYRRVGDVPPRIGDRPAVDRTQPDQRLDQFGLTVATHARNAEDFARS